MGITEKKMETTIISRGIYSDYIGILGDILGLYIGVMEKKMETTIMGLYGVL